MKALAILCYAVSWSIAGVAAVVATVAVVLGAVGSWGVDQADRLWNKEPL